MKEVVIIPGGFHPFHAGHYELYKSAKKAFPNADVYVAATNDQSERPFPFSLKQKLAKLAGVDPSHFVQVKSPFSADEITSKYDPNDTILIFVKSEKNSRTGSDPEGPFPAEVDPKTGQLPLVTRGPNKGKPVSNRLQYFKGNEKNLQPMSKHTYLAYLPTVEFGPGITSGSQIRKAWPTLDDRRKTAMVMSLYPVTQKNPKLAQNVVGMFDQVMGSQVDEERHVDGGLGPNYPGTYEQEHATDQRTNRHHTYDLTSESLETDPEIAKTMAFAKQHYPSNAAKQEAFTKFVIHALRHSEQDDRHQDEEITDLQHQIDLLKAKVNVSESQDYLDEK